MKPLSTDILTALQASFQAHLTAIEQYESQAQHFTRWGYSKLAAHFTSEAEEERSHSRKLLSRIEFFDSAPVFQHNPANYPGRDLVGILAANLSLETLAAQIERDGITKARASGDEVTAAIFTENLEGSEQSIQELEAMQSQIEDVTLSQFLSTQI